MIGMVVGSTRYELLCVFNMREASVCICLGRQGTLESNSVMGVSEQDELGETRELSGHLG